MTEFVDFIHGHLFCGIGGGAQGFNDGEARLGNRVLRYRCAGGVDVDAGAIRAFSERTSIAGTVLDLFSREQYTAFHGHEPPPEWREATPLDIQRAMQFLPLHCLFLSAPCKGLSGLLSEQRSLSAKYQALNHLSLRGLMLALEAYKNDPIPFVLFENVPRIATRGRSIVDQLISLLHAYGYATAETTHDCGELGGLAQSRNRWLLVARHMEKVPPFLYEPQKKPLISVGRLLEKFPLPGDPVAGPMHRIPALQWKTWVRLAFVRAGEDWRSLQKLAVEDGVLRDYAIAREYRNGVLGVTDWSEHSGVVAGESLPMNGKFSVADPRVDGHGKSVQLGVRPWTDAAPTVTGKMHAGQGPFSVADPRLDGVRHNNVFRVVRWDEVGKAVTAGGHPTSGGVAIADPRVGYGENSHRNKLRVVPFDGRAGTVTGADRVGSGAQSVADPRVFSVADPRSGLNRSKGDHYHTAGHYGVVPWTSSSYAIAGRTHHDRGFGSVADPRLPGADDRLICLIRALDGTWHRPFTTLDLAALQGLVDPDEHMALPGKSDSQHREWIGNCVPPPAARAIASAMGQAWLLAMAGETFALGATPIWVRPIAIALSVSRSVPA